MAKKLETKEVVKKKKAPKPQVEKIGGLLKFKRINSDTLIFDVDSFEVVAGKKIVFTNFLPEDFNVSKHKITGSVEYKIEITKI